MIYMVCDLSILEQEAKDFLKPEQEFNTIRILL